jgi:hypothetical protein
MHSHSLQRFLVLVVGAFLDVFKTDTLKSWWSHGTWVLDGFQAERCLPPPAPWPTSHPAMSHSAQPTALQEWALSFCFRSSCFVLVMRLRILINHQLGLLDHSVGQGDKWKAWPIPLCCFCCSLVCQVLVGGRTKPDRQRAFSVIHERCFDFFGLNTTLVISWLLA